ncbi:MAG: c-type cytochrome, partial [Alphaproteobacteria bacterium]
MDTMKLNKIAAAVLLAGVVAMTTGFVTRLIHPAASGAHGGHGDEKRVLAAYAAEEGAATETASAPAGPEPIEGLLAAADPADGEKVFKKCQACHTDEKGGANKVGPNLYGIVGNDVATHDGFSYSGALLGVPGNWTYEALNEFLYNPKVHVPGTKMAFAGLRKAEDRAAIIALLRSLDDSPEPLPYGGGIRRAARPPVDPRVPAFAPALACRLADAARPILQGYYRQAIPVDGKADASPVTRADGETEAAPRSVLTAAAPDHGVLGEEHGAENV